MYAKRALCTAAPYVWGRGGGVGEGAYTEKRGGGAGGGGGAEIFVKLAVVQLAGAVQQEPVSTGNTVCTHALTTKSVELQAFVRQEDDGVDEIQ
jgi:hypothetical protein